MDQRTCDKELHQEIMSDFQRPPVSEWMSPPKSSNIPVWRSIKGEDEGSSSTGWSTPPQSRKTNSQSDEHFSLHLSPDVSITLHSPKSVNAIVSSKSDAGSKKFSLKILSPKHGHEKIDVTDLPGTDVHHPMKTVHKTVLKEFIPPNHSTIKDAKIKQKIVKKIEIPDYKSPYSFSPPKKLSPEKPKPEIERKRHIDVKSTQDYIREQRKKRIKIVQAEKSKIKIESEEKKKRLEELRLRTLELANASKKQAKGKTKTSLDVKMVENEDDTSLGVCQVRPKRSFQESLASLGKPVVLVPVPAKQEEISQDAPKENDPSLDATSISRLRNDKYIAEIRKLSGKLTEPNKDASESLIKLARAIEKRIDEKSNRRKMMSSIENIPQPKRIKTVAVDAQAIDCLKNEIKEIASGFQTLQSAIARDGEFVERKRDPNWLLTIQPHPYNVVTAVENKIKAVGKIQTTHEKLPSPTKSSKSKSVEKSPRLSIRSAEIDKKSDSGSELSSSILDDGKSETKSSISEEISSYHANVVLMPTDAKLNNTVVGDFGKRSEATMTQVIDNLSGNSEKEEKIKNSNNTRSDPFQALLDSEFHRLDNLQKNLTRFVEIKAKTEKAVNTETVFNDNWAQTSNITSTINSEIDLDESIKTDISQSNQFEESVKNSESTNTGVSLEMLTRMIKEEEIRSEHQLALIQLRQHALVEKTKACLNNLEEKKKMLKDKNSKCAIKKKQRGILLRYQSEQQEIERLKRMNRMASDERRVMIQQQEQIHQMQQSTKEIMSKLSIKQSDSSGSEIAEEVASQNSSNDSINTFIQHSNASENVSEEEVQIYKHDVEKLNKCKKILGQKEQTLMQQKHFVEEILEWEQRLQAEETRIKEMEKQALRAAKPVTTLLRPAKLNESSSVSVSIPEIVSAASDDIPEEITKPVSTARSYTSESFESSSDAPKSIPITKTLPMVKPVLSPRHRARRRYSSGSDDSANLSHTETASEPSDVECRLKALEEQLRCRKMEADRLRREHKRKQRERLKEKEESLKKQIEAYDDYIEKLKRDFEQECKKTSPVIKPVIKQPRAGKIQIEEKSIVEEVEEKISEPIEEVSEEKISESIKEEEISESIKEEKISNSIEEESPEKEQTNSIIQASEEKIETDETSSIVEESEEKNETNETASIVEESEEKIETNETASIVEESDEKIETEEKISMNDTIESNLIESLVDSDGSVKTTLKLDEEEENQKSAKIDSDSYETDSFESDEENDEKNVDAIVEQLLNHLLDETINTVDEITKKRREKLADEISNGLAGKILNDALTEIFEIYSNKLKNDEEIYTEVTWDVRRRIHEIMGSQMSLKNRNCDQSTLKTTYDVSPSHSPTHGNGIFEQEEFISSLNQEQSKEVQVNHDQDGQEWFDEDFGLTKSRREAEALRLQQLQIEQEIEELQAQQEQVPYFYLREIPNKPPPPYTPPCKPTVPNVPTSETEITRHVRLFAKSALKKLRGHLTQKPDLSHHFTRSLWDLAHELVSEAISSVPEDEEEDEKLPWHRLPLPLAKWRQKRRSMAEDVIIDKVVERSLILFGLRPRVEQETLIVRWSRNKRDHVDELLVWDSQAEEAEWTCYDQEIIEVKNEVADELMDSLLQETASIFNEILKKKY